MTAKTRRAKTKNGHAPPTPPPEQIIMTLRISPEDRARLHKYTMRLSRDVPHRVSYNAAMIQLIREHA